MAVKGNKCGIKLKIPHIRQEAYTQYCEWIGKGKPKKAWSFEHDEFTCSYRTMDKYIEQNPDEFPAIKKEIAQAKSYNHWIEIGINMMNGKVAKCQPALYQMFMRNMFGWDKEKDGHKETNRPLVQVLAEKWRNYNAKGSPGEGENSN